MDSSKIIFKIVVSCDELRVCCSRPHIAFTGFFHYLLCVAIITLTFPREYNASNTKNIITVSRRNKLQENKKEKCNYRRVLIILSMIFIKLILWDNYIVNFRVGKHVNNTRSIARQRIRKQ